MKLFVNCTAMSLFLLACGPQEHLAGYKAPIVEISPLFTIKLAQLRAPLRANAAADRYEERHNRAQTACNAALADILASGKYPANSVAECANGREEHLEFAPISECNAPESNWGAAWHCAVSSWYFDVRVFAPVDSV